MKNVIIFVVSANYHLLLNAIVLRRFWNVVFGACATLPNVLRSFILVSFFSYVSILHSTRYERNVALFSAVVIEGQYVKLA